MTPEQIAELEARLPLLLGVAEVAALAGLKPRSLRNRVLRGGKPRAFKVGRRLRFARADVVAFLCSGATDA